MEIKEIRQKLRDLSAAPFVCALQIEYVAEQVEVLAWELRQHKEVE